MFHVLGYCNLCILVANNHLLNFDTTLKSIRNLIFFKIKNLQNIYDIYVQFMKFSLEFNNNKTSFKIRLLLNSHYLLNRYPSFPYSSTVKHGWLSLLKCRIHGDTIPEILQLTLNNSVWKGSRPAGPISGIWLRDVAHSC